MEKSEDLNDDPIAELITSFNELNAGAVEELDEEPSPLEFMRYVARNTPFVVRRGASDWPAVRRWTASYLRDELAGHHVNVAVTPYGNADAPTEKDGHLVFAKPHEEDQPFEEFLDYLTSQELSSSHSSFSSPESRREVRYAQTQNDNLRNEYSSLYSQVPPSIPFARIALQKDPDAVNLWIGSSASVTALHRDNYENVYVQVAGRKHFVLLPALCQPCVNEQELEPASYVREAAGGGNLLRLQSEEDGDKVPFAIWDPDHPTLRSTKYSHLARPLRVTLDPGDMLYLPAMW
ncbi:Clavaminate synthase-like protein [Daldinia caldariorum]|uniref:Clavaminate synthase-like protein n=1 Tax=Daldinia caldariorum TaxID=326644 RepID=UPI002007BF4F|nr:Clavaminate synthase-like protein [Daldinia caldariorum]KAI1469786.1 Clavaminate synthase-like protein [Daldinia caldariorum]